MRLPKSSPPEPIADQAQESLNAPRFDIQAVQVCVPRIVLYIRMCTHYRHRWRDSSTARGDALAGTLPARLLAPTC